MGIAWPRSIKYLESRLDDEKRKEGENIKERRDVAYFDAQVLEHCW